MPENLSSYVGRLKRELWEDIKSNREPRVGEFDAALLANLRSKEAVQIGTATFRPDRITLEFLFPEASGVPTILSVSIAPPERIVFLPVPEWVIETIWQGDVDGSFHFESDANKLLDKFLKLVTAEENKPLFEKQLAKRRE